MNPIEAINWEDFMRQDAHRWAPHALTQDNPFLTLPWLQTWWEHFGSRQRAEILLRRNDTGVPTEVFFTRHLRESYYGAPLRIIRGWVNNHCARAGVHTENDSAAFVTELSDYWLNINHKCDALRLQGLPVEFGGLLSTQLRNHGIQVITEREWAHHILRIDRPWDEYFNELSSETRRVQGRLGRRLQEQGRCEWRRYEGLDVAQALDHYFEIEEQSWKAQSGEVIKRDPNLLSFYRTMMLRFAADGCSFIDLLFLNDLPICGVLSLRYQQQLFTLKTCYRKEFAKYSPGWQLFRRLLEKSFSDNTIAVDFCSDIGFSARWATQETPFCDLMIFSRTARGRLAGTGKKLLNRLRETVT